MSLYYILDGKVPKAVSPAEWARWFEFADRKVASTVIGEVTVSTVFLGMNHNFAFEGPRQVFETMIFGGEHDQYQKRAATWGEAEKDHAAAVAMVVTHKDNKDGG